MKLIYRIFTIVCFVFILQACGGSSSDKNEIPNVPSTITDVATANENFELPYFMLYYFIVINFT